MEEIKNLVKKLLQKEPNAVESFDYDVTISYYSANSGYEILLSNSNNKYTLHLSISANSGYYDYCTELSEKDFMEMKWIAEKWEDSLKNKVFDEFRDFVNSNINPADDLLNDD